MGLTVSKGLSDLATLFSGMKNVYFKNGELTATDLANEALTVDLELPVLEDANFDTGAPDVSQIKLISGKIWAQKTKRGDSDISFNVASVDGEINDLLLNVSSANVTGKVGSIVPDATYSGKGYNLDPKVVKGSLICVSEDKSTIIAIANASIVSSLNAADGDNPAYFKLVVTPFANSAGDEIYILKKN